MPSILKKFCNCCRKHLTKSYFRKHLTTRKHRKNAHTSIEKLQEKEEIKNNVLTFPKEILDIIIDYKEDMEKNQQLYDISDSVNKKILKKIEKKSFRVYSREIKLNKLTKITDIRDILSANINKDLYIQYLYKTNWVVRFSEDKMTKAISFQYNPMVHNPLNRLMVMFH